MRSVVKRNVHFLGISRFSHSLLLVLLSPVVQFSMINSLSRTHSRAHSLGIIPHLVRFVKRFFKSFLKNFFQPLPKGGSVVHYTTACPVCQEVFQNFFEVFGSLLSKPTAAGFVHSAEADCRKPNYYSTPNRICQASKAFFCLCILNILLFQKVTSTGTTVFLAKSGKLL